MTQPKLNYLHALGAVHFCVAETLVIGRSCASMPSPGDGEAVR